MGPLPPPREPSSLPASVGSSRLAAWAMVSAGPVAALALFGCVTSRPAPAVTAPAPTPVPADPAARAPEPEPSPSARYFPGADLARTERTRKPTAVLLFAPPSPPLPEGTLASVETLRLQPIVCSLHGKLAVGARCGEVMPARATVRLTQAGDFSREELEVERSTVAFRDEAGGHVYPAPYAPACCMYNTCVGRTVPYSPKKTDARSVWVTTKTVLAVWPADAEIDLTVFSPGPAEDVKLDDAPWSRPSPNRPDRTDRPTPRLTQSLQVGTRRYAVVAEDRMRGSLFMSPGSATWQQLSTQPGARDHYILSASDLDGNGQPEILVYAHWANDYGLHLYTDAPQPLYGFSCGNI